MTHNLIRKKRWVVTYQDMEKYIWATGKENAKLAFCIKYGIRASTRSALFDVIECPVDEDKTSLLAAE